MTINQHQLKGSTQLIYSNERVRIATVDADGYRSFACYVHRTKTIHSFDDPNTMQDFLLDMALVPSTAPVHIDDFKERLKVLIAVKFQERCKIGDSLSKVLPNLFKHNSRKFQSGDMMWESTCPEIDDECAFLFPHGISGIYSTEPETVEFHKPASSWTYEHINDAIIEFVKSYGGDCTITEQDHKYL